MAASGPRRGRRRPPLALTPNAAYRIDGPRGLRRDESADERGQLSGVPAPRAGEYAISGPAANALRIGASVLSASETSLGAVDQIQFNDQLTVRAASAAPKTDRPLWWPIAACGFALLLVEWWWFQRRPLTA